MVTSEYMFPEEEEDVERYEVLRVRCLSGRLVCKFHLEEWGEVEKLGRQVVGEARQEEMITKAHYLLGKSFRMVGKYEESRGELLELVGRGEGRLAKGEWSLLKVKIYCYFCCC